MKKKSSKTNRVNQRHVVCCAGKAVECQDFATAKECAANLVHQHNAVAVIFKPILKVEPKREIKTTSVF